MNIQKQTLNKKETQILNILIGKTLYEKQTLNFKIFSTDLVLKMKIPMKQDQKTIDKNKYVSIDEFIYNPDRNLVQAHQAAYQQLFQQVPHQDCQLNVPKNQKNIKIRNQVNFQRLNQTQFIQTTYDVILGNQRKTFMTFPCHTKCKSTVVDSFTLNYNTLIFVLQKKCGFQTNSFYVQQMQNGQYSSAYIYILITQNTSNLLKAADKYQIKKQIDYCQIDLFLNQPVDSLGRPYQNNSYVSKPQLRQNILKQIRQRTIRQDNQSKPNLHLNSSAINQVNKSKQYLRKQNEIKQLFKRVHRNMKDKSYKINQFVINQSKIKENQEREISAYLIDFFTGFDQILQEDVQLTQQQKFYIYEINRHKINPKCQKEYILKLKRKKVFQLIKDLSKKYSHRTYKTPISYFPFILPSKKLSFMQRLKSSLLYQEHQVSPYGDYSLFCKMDRIKIAYLNLKRHVRVGNLNKLDCMVFTLHDDFQRFGTISQALVQRKVIQSIKGGINGRNLFYNWNPLTPWKADHITIRNYFGQQTAYQVYLKTHLILYFIIITPLGVIGQVVSRLFIYYNSHYTQYMDRGFSSTHKQQLIFHLSFFALTIGIFAFFLESWLNKQAKFIENFVENETQSNFRYEYVGPFIRNNVTDSVNEHRLTPNYTSVIMKSFGFLLILIILGGESGFFHGMRMAIVELIKVFPQTNVYLISWAHICGYGIFFVVNYFFYRFFITKFSQFLTRKQNTPTQDLHRDSVQAKNSLFLIGIQMIPLIFLLILQPFGSTSCYSSSCQDEFSQYIYSRYVIVFIFLAVKLLSFLFLYIQEQIRKKRTSRYQIVSFEQKLQNYLNFIESESIKPDYVSSIEDQTQALLHYGLFLTTFPLSPLLGLSNIILQYLVQRIELTVRNKRPIPKSQQIHKYSGNYKLIMHLSIFVNSWIIFYSMEEVQYSFQRLIRIFVSQAPTYSGILILKIMVIIITVLIYELQVLIIRYLVSYSQDKVLNNRKRMKYQKHVLFKNVAQKNKPTLQINKIHPFRTVFRTYHRQVIQRSTKANNILTQSDQGTYEQTSAQQLKDKKK